MEEGKKSNEPGRKENEGGGEKPNNKEMVDDDEGIKSTDIKEKEGDGKEKPANKSEDGESEQRGKPIDKEKKKVNANEKTADEAEEVDDDRRVKDKDGKEDETQKSANKEDKEDYEDKDEKEVKKEVLKEANDKVHGTEVQDVVNMDKEDLKKVSTENLPSEEGIIQLKMLQYQTTPINIQDEVTSKQEPHIHEEKVHEIKLVNGETLGIQSSNNTSSSKEFVNNEQDKKTNALPKDVEHITEAAVDRTEEKYDINKSLQIGITDQEKESQKEGIEMLDNLDNEPEKDRLIEVLEEMAGKEDTVINKESILEGDITVSVNEKEAENITFVGSQNVPSVSNKVQETLHMKAKEQEESSVTNEVEGIKDKMNVAQEKNSENESQEISSSSEAIKSLIQNETGSAKQEHQEKTSKKAKNEAVNKLQKEINMKDLKDTVKGKKEKHENKEQQKQLNGNKTVSDSSNNAKGLVIKKVAESSIDLNKNKKDTQQEECDVHLCTSQEMPVKSKEHIAKSSDTLSSIVTLPPKKSDEKDQSQGTQNKSLDVSAAEKRIHTVFQGTALRDTKCEESIQRSSITNSRQNQESNRIEAAKSAPTDTVINDQLKQLECKVQQPPQEKSVHQKEQTQENQHEQKPKQTQKQMPQKQQEQREVEQKQPQPQKSPAEQKEKQKLQKQTQKRSQQKEEKEQIRRKQEHGEDQPKQQKKKEQPSQEQQQEQPKQQKQSEEGEDDSAPGCGGMQGRNCPIYFGVKSYLHQFYDSTPVKNSQLYEDYVEEDDFEYTVDPIKNRGCRKCCRGFWFRAGLWGGINLILVGVITLLVGYLTPQREMIVGHHNNLEILDRTAIAFNRRLELCRLAGLAVFCCGGLVLLLTLLLSTFFHVGGHNNNNGYCCGENAYYGYVTTSLVEPFIAGQVQGSPVPVATGIKIPITEQIKSVQPTLWPDIATVKDGALVPHMP